MSARTEQRKLAAIMFTDMGGYSALSQRNEAFALEPVPQGRPTIAQRFIAGSRRPERGKPRRGDRTFGEVHFFRPSGALALARFSPAINRWAILYRPPGWRQ